MLCSFTDFFFLAETFMLYVFSFHVFFAGPQWLFFACETLNTDWRWKLHGRVILLNSPPLLPKRRRLFTKSYYIENTFEHYILLVFSINYVYCDSIVHGFFLIELVCIVVLWWLGMILIFRFTSKCVIQYNYINLPFLF